jgi:hypothetical protein
MREGEEEPSMSMVDRSESSPKDDGNENSCHFQMIAGAGPVQLVAQEYKAEILTSFTPKAHAHAQIRRFFSERLEIE